MIIVINIEGSIQMKKRYLIITVAVLALAAFIIPAAFAENTVNPAKTWFDQMFAAKKAYVDQAVQSGQMTEEQGKAYKDHFDQMYQLQQQNGFSCPGGGTGAGITNGGKGRGMGRGGQCCGFGMGNGLGANGGFGQSQVQK